jgi:hypothetical protein
MLKDILCGSFNIFEFDLWFWMVEQASRNDSIHGDRLFFLMNSI